ncbi:sensor histidine kinase [Caenimonas soli]|uniref:sensor histidine kinase n=1 Tax=Caenimonas soli TaxID=2735555 RepID=UPI00155765AF|nr:histidine kinase [Caenimonas soli]NPC56895.1 histidine kinase [Caenimonas soli]
MKIDWIATLRHMLQVLAFCLVVATIQYGFQPERPYGPNVVYSLFIGTIIWAVIDLGRHLFPSSAETGWPQGLAGLGLVVGGIVAGYLLGTTIATQLCIYYGWFPAGAPDPDSNQWRTSILITGLAGIAGTFYFYSINKSAYLQRKMGEAHEHANEARLKLLEAQLDPHMLFNTLANLRALIGTDPNRAQQMLDLMIAFLRATLNGSRATTHTLQAEFDRLRDYLELMAIRMGPRLWFLLHLPPELAQHPVPALLLQPIVENSIQHGLEPKVAGGRVLVSARREAGQLVLEVVDTGVGPSMPPEETTGFGMTQVRERLAALYGTNASFDFATQLGGGSRTTIRLPLQP